MKKTKLSIGVVVDRDNTVDKSLRKKDKTKWNNSIKELIVNKQLARNNYGKLCNNNL